MPTMVASTPVSDDGNTIQLPSPNPPPWRNNDSPVQHDFRQDVGAQLSRNASGVSFTPIPAEPTHHVTSGGDKSPPPTSPKHDDVTLPLPWRCERSAETKNRMLPLNSSLPPSWRQLSTESGALR